MSASSAESASLRPLVHFTAIKGWLNDPNGCLFHEGEWHLFYQHNPQATEWGNISWGHAVSTDLLHWEELPVALVPDAQGMIFSGSAIIDQANTAGFQTGCEPTMVAAFTYAGDHGTPPGPYTQALALSHDRGRTWTKHPENPVLGNIGGGGDRDPKVFWHEPTGRWVMALYVDAGKGSRSFALLNSPDLKSWQLTQTLPDFYECPELYVLSVAEAEEPLWVLQEANSAYVVGRFDGVAFTALQPRRRLDFGTNYYAAQNFNDAPGSQPVQIAWMGGGRFPGAPFNQQMSLPCALRLEKDGEGYVVCRRFMLDFAQGTEAAYSGAEDFAGAVERLENRAAYLRLEGVFREGLEIETREASYRLEPGSFRHGETVVELPQIRELSLVEIVIDRTSVEILLNGGRAGGSFSITAAAQNHGLRIHAPGLSRGTILDL